MNLRTLACLALLAGCGPRESSGEAVGTSDPITVGGSGGEAPPVEGAIELGLRRADGTFLDVGDLRGSVTLLFVLATFDGASQMLFTPLREIAERHPDVQIVGIASQHGARLLVDAYEHALAPPFPITYDPEDSISAGTSALGVVESVPMLIALDREGREVRRHVGFLQVPEIEALLREAGM